MKQTLKVWARVKKWSELTNFDTIFESDSLLDFTSFIDGDTVYHLGITEETMYNYFVEFHGEWVISKKYDLDDPAYNAVQITKIKNIIDMIARINKNKYRIMIKSIFQQYGLDTTADYFTTKTRTPDITKDGSVTFTGSEDRTKTGTESTTNTGNINNKITTFDSSSYRNGSSTNYDNAKSELTFNNRKDTLSFSNRENTTSETETGTETTTETGYKGSPVSNIEAAREAAQFNVLDVLMKDILDKITLSIII